MSVPSLCGTHFPQSAEHQQLAFHAPADVAARDAPADTAARDPPADTAARDPPADRTARRSRILPHDTIRESEQDVHAPSRPENLPDPDLRQQSSDTDASAVSLKFYLNQSLQ